MNEVESPIDVDMFGNGYEIKKLLKPETPLELQIIEDSDFIIGAISGVPRPGHPEGQIQYHIREVLDNVDKHTKSLPELRKKLRLIALIHDTFKYKVAPKQSASGENHHAMIARRFAERYIDDTEILDIIELHDEAYNAWCNGDRDGKWEKADARVNRLFDRLGVSVFLFRYFYQSDNETGNKDQANYQWFLDKSYERQYPSTKRNDTELATTS